MAELVTIEGVEIVSTGTYMLSSGERTFSQEDLEAAVAAAADPTVTTPRLKIGHDDPRFDDAIASGELSGEPAFGQVANLRLSEDRQTVVGDYINVPAWLAETIESSYPGRSIEGSGGPFTAASGRTYDFVIFDVALLGVTWPGVGSLADLGDLQTVLTANGVVERPTMAADGSLHIQRGGQDLVVARARVERANGVEPTATKTGTVAGIDLGQVCRSFCADLDEGEIPTEELEDVGPTLWWWPRSIRLEDDGSTVLIVDDDEGHLIRIPFTVAGNELEYGSPEVVMETFVAVQAATSQQGPRVLASWANARAASRPSQTEETRTMDIDLSVLRPALGLAEDADEEAVTAELAKRAEAKSEPEATPAATTAAAQVPDGMALVDAETLGELREGAKDGREAKAALDEQDRDSVLTAAIKAGKFAAGRRSHYETLWAKDREGTRHLLTASVGEGGLAAGLIPVDGRPQGRTGDGENDPSIAAAALMEFRRQYFPELVREEVAA